MADGDVYVVWGYVAGSPLMHYRLSSLVHSLSLNGGLAPLVATAYLLGERAFVEPGANLLVDDKQVGEVDLLGWSETTLFAGEAKTSAAGFAMSDVTADVGKAALTGADTFLAVCLEPIGRETCDALNDACAEHGMSLRQLDGPELLLA